MNEKEFNIIYDQHEKMIWNLAFRLTGIKEAAEDICQDVFTKVWEKRNRVCEVTDLKGYLLKMTKNLCINQFRKIVVKKRALLYFQSMYSEFYFEDVVLLKEYKRIIHESVQRLPLKEKEAFAYHEAGFKRSKIATIMKVSKNTTDYQVASAKKKLRSYIDQVFGYTVKNAA